MKNNILSNFQQMSAFKDSPFGQFWEKRLPSWALETYGTARVFNQSNFSTVDASKKSSAAPSDFYNNLVDENWKDIKFFVFAHPDGDQVLKDYANSNNSPKENEVYFFIETDDGKFDFGKIVRVKLGKKAIEKLRFQFPFLNQTDEKELANEFLKRSFEINKGSDYDFIQASKEVKLNTEELKNLLAKAIKYDYQQKKFDDMSWSLKLLQGMDLLGVSIPQKLMQISGEMRAQKYDEDKYWNAEIPKDFTPLFLPRVIVPDKRKDIKESILKSLKQKIDDITNYDKEAGVLEKVYKEILGNVLLYLFDSFSSSLEEGIKILNKILPEGESLNDLYNLNAFLVGLWNGCLEFVAGIIDLIALVLVIERDGLGYTISDKLTEQLEEFFNELVFNFRDFIKKLWGKFNLAVTDFQLWYLEYGDNPYYGYKTLGELTPDILSILFPELLAGKAGRASGISEEVLSKSARELSEKLEQKTAQKEVKKSFEKAETALEDKIPNENKIEDVILESSKALRASVLKKWAIKFEKKFHLHFDGEFRIQEKGGIKTLKGTGGHNHSVIGKNIKVRKYLTEPIDDMPFDALIEVRYKNGQWIEKQAKSSMFPKNWDITRVKEEIALVYEQMIKSGYKLQWDNNKYFGKSSTGFEIQIEIDKSGNLTNAFPNIK